MKHKTQPHQMRVIWNTNAMFSTSGYGQQAADLLPLIRDEGYPIAVINFFGSQGGKFVLDGILNYPIVNHVYGSDALWMHGRDFGADVSFTLQDTWVLNPEDLRQTKRWIPYVPIDHDPMPIPVLNNLRLAYRVIAMSRFGQREMQRNGIMSTYIPHTVNTEVFKPIDKIARKKESNLPEDCYLIGMIAANKENPPRKSFQEVIDAFHMFLQKVPNALLYIHSNPDFPGGFNFKQYADFLGIGDKLAFPDAYQANFNTDKVAMNLLYNSFDLLVAPSISEGFGIPIIEAQACGVPVITNNFTSMPELIVPHITGYAVKLKGKRFSPQGSYMGIPDENDIYNGMMEFYRKDRENTAIACRANIIKNYDLATVFETKWKPYLAMLEHEIYPDVDKAKTA